jgi:hypothetical protein
VSWQDDTALKFEGDGGQRVRLFGSESAAPTTRFARSFVGGGRFPEGQGRQRAAVVGGGAVAAGRVDRN